MPFEENTYVAWLPGRADAVVIDPGLEPEFILDFLRDEGLTPAAILNTHGHADHIAGNEAMKTGVPDRSADHRRRRDAAAGQRRAEPERLRSASRSSARRPTARWPRATWWRRRGCASRCSTCRATRRATWSSCSAGPPCLVFGGDVLFRGGVGRTDFPGGDARLALRRHPRQAVRAAGRTRSSTPDTAPSPRSVTRCAPTRSWRNDGRLAAPRENPLPSPMSLR